MWSYVSHATCEIRIFSKRLQSVQQMRQQIIKRLIFQPRFPSIQPCSLLFSAKIKYACMQVLPICFHQTPQTVACDSVDTPVLTKNIR